ncbi:VOC family protein [Psychromicrobium xiongbiense]|uniref:VOC family protein n=1 Tax=Psychromicrobium xiongbiense TaxID=3051184 RepID=UPI002553EF98|nr:VOC family protein [Psychromicrobium sp. YIM S02556]
MPAITNCLWFDQNGEEAAEYYCSIFPRSEITAISRYGDGGPFPAGTALTVAFELDGRAFTALNGGPMFTFNEAVSFQIDCADQAEVDYYWEKLGDGGRESQCGWIQDKFGLWWQVVPTVLPELLGGDGEAAGRVAQVFMQMSKFDIAALEAAYRGEINPRGE